MLSMRCTIIICIQVNGADNRILLLMGVRVNEGVEKK